MGVQHLQIFLEEKHIVPVELFNISRNLANSKTPKKSKNKLELVVDGESCLDRLYGGFYSDWVSGGQWCRMNQFLTALTDSCLNNNVHLTVAFNGAFESERMSEWVQKQIKTKTKASAIIRHLRKKGTPPPKVWWIPPVFLSTALKYAISHGKKMAVICSLDDHHYEIMNYCRGKDLHGIVGDDPEYIVFDPPRYFSGAALKLTRKGHLETNEYMIRDLASGLELTKEQLCIVASLLGNHLLHEVQLGAFHTLIGINPQKNTSDVILQAVANYVKNLEALDNLEALADEVFLSIGTHSVKKNLFIQSIQYYLNGQSDSQNFTGQINKEIPSECAASAVRDDREKLFHSCLPEILQVARNRHQKGLMIPFVYHILNKNEIKLPVLLEDESVRRELPSIHVIYRPVRQMVYGILFNLHYRLTNLKQKKSAGDKSEPSEVQDIVIKEWVWSTQNPYHQPEQVQAIPLDWPVPKIEHLWFGSGEDCGRRRLRAFLSCLKSDSPRMVCPHDVPQHLLVTACVLRYLLQVNQPVLKRCELDTFLVTVFSPLSNFDFIEGIQLQDLTVRGVTLATLFMQGIETAALVNDVCGSPIPSFMFCPWLYFDGKLFQYFLSNTDQIHSFELKIGRMRAAILDGLDVTYVTNGGTVTDEQDDNEDVIVLGEDMNALSVG